MIPDGQYGIKWLVMEKSLSGFCMARKSLVVITQPSAIALGLKHIDIRNGYCSMGNGCYDLQCPLNHTTFRSARKHSVFGELLRTEKEWRRRVVKIRHIRDDFDKAVLDKIFSAEGHIIFGEVLKEEEGEPRSSSTTAESSVR